MSNVYEIALSYVVRGSLAVIPLKVDGSKSPSINTWKAEDRSTPDTVRAQFVGTGTKVAIGIKCGEASGNLEVLDFENKKGARCTYDEWYDLVCEMGGQDLVDRLPKNCTPSGGKHVLWRSETPHKGTRVALARPAADAPPKTKPILLIETRGHGQYVVAPGSPTETHEAKKPYSLESGDIFNVPVITDEEREILLTAARSFNEVVDDPKPDALEQKGRPGDEYNSSSVTWADILEPHGWRRVKTKGATVQWQRPGKEGNFPSANEFPSGVLFVHSSAAHPFDVKPYTKFSAYALLNHGGDFKEAAKALGKQGYGAPLGTTLRLVPREATSVEGFEELFDLNTDAKNAERFIKDWAHVVRFCKEGGHCSYNTKKWVIGDKGVWVELAKKTALRIQQEIESAPQDARPMLAKWANKSQNNDRIQAMLRLAESDPRIQCKLVDFDADPLLFNCENGTINLLDGSLRPHSPDDMCSKISPVRYNQAAKCPMFADVLDAAFAGDHEMICYIRRLGGYSLTGFKKRLLPICFGSGANSKSVVLNALQSVFGEYAVTTPAATFMKRPDGQIPNDIARLAGMRFVCVLEVTRGQQFDDGLVKNLTGGEQMSARFLNKEWFDFDFIAVPWMRANTLPRLNDHTKSMERRIRVIPWMVTVPTEQQDEKLSEKLQAEREGILAFLVAGWLEYGQVGEMPPEQVMLSSQSYRDENDPLGDFLREYAEFGKGYACWASELFTSYKKFCEETEVRPWTQTRFGTELRERGVEVDRKSRGIKYIGIKPKGV